MVLDVRHVSAGQAKRAVETSRRDEAQAARVLQFMNLLKDPKGGSLRNRAALKWLPWQKQLFVDLFSTYGLDGRRQYREAFIEIPRKNGKSTTIAACVTYELFMGRTFGQEIYSAANDRDQASLVFNMVASMIRANSALMKRCKIYDSTKRIVRRDTESVYRALSRDAATAHGLNPSFVIYDELHEAKTRDLYDALKTGQGAREEPLFVTITTAGDDMTGVCYELYRYAKQVASGVVTDKTFYPLIFEAEAEDDIWDEATWRKANPSAGAFRDLEEIRAFAERAKAIPTMENAFRRLYLNQWVQAHTKWLNTAAWRACGDPVDVERLRGRRCYAGLDLASVDDFSALVLVFPEEDGTFTVLPYFWIPEGRVHVRRGEGAQLSAWVRQGFIQTTPGDVVDYGFILRKIKEIKEVYDIREIAFDRWGAAKLRADIEETTDVPMVQFGQGFASMSAPMKELERMILSKAIRHGGHPVLTWMADNTVAKVDPAGNIKPDKEKSTEKIDGMTALIMGLDRAIRWRDQFSRYEHSPVRVIDLN